MSGGLWIPGMAAGPQEELVERVHRQIERFATDAGVKRAFVEVELVDGTRFALDSLSAEPGFGFLTLAPHAALEEDLPERLIVPVGSIRRIELARAEEQRARLGFSLPAPSA
jgi:hypothetical protein